MKGGQIGYRIFHIFFLNEGFPNLHTFAPCIHVDTVINVMHIYISKKSHQNRKHIAKMFRLNLFAFTIIYKWGSIIAYLNSFAKLLHLPDLCHLWPGGRCLLFSVSQSRFIFH